MFSKMLLKLRITIYKWAIELEGRLSDFSEGHSIYE